MAEVKGVGGSTPQNVKKVDPSQELVLCSETIQSYAPGTIQRGGKLQGTVFPSPSGATQGDSSHTARKVQAYAEHILND